MTPKAKALLMQARIDPMSVVASGNWQTWCAKKHPDKEVKHVCSRPKGHKGPHFAQYDDGGICDCKPNPWTSRRRKR